MNLGALLKDKLGEDRHEEEEHEESGSSAFDTLFDALKSDDREGAKAAFDHAVYEHMMEMDDEDDEEDVEGDKGGILIAMGPKKEMHSDRKKKSAYGSPITEQERKGGIPITEQERKEAERMYQRLSRRERGRYTGSAITPSERKLGGMKFRK